MILSTALIAAYAATLAAAGPVKLRRDVEELNPEATAEAHQRDDTATRAFSNVQIKTSDGRCLFVDPLSGDFRANLGVVEVADCGSSDGQGWDVITEGIHNDQPGKVLIVNVGTQACLNADPRREQGDQIITFSCGGRADGSGEVTNSQLFAFDGSSGPLTLEPSNGPGFCLFQDANVINIDSCREGASAQLFTIGDAVGSDDGADEEVGEEPVAEEPAAPTEDAETPVITAPPSADFPAENPTEPVPVSRAGGFLDPEAAAEAHTVDTTAVKAKDGVSIRASTGDCLSVDPTAGDFRQNLIPVAVAPCDDSPNQKFSLISSGVHNNGDAGAVLIVSDLTNGAISFDPRRPSDDQVTIFSAGGRAAGEGETDNAQLFPFEGGDSLVLEPLNGNGQSCLEAGGERIVSAACTDADSQVFELV